MLKKTAAVTATGALLSLGLSAPGAALAGSTAPSSGSEDVRTIHKGGETLTARRSNGLRPSALVPSASSQRLSGLEAGSARKADFDGDGYDDVVSAHTAVDPEGSRSGVVILYTSAAASDQGYSHWRFERYLSSVVSLTSGDFNGDGYDDLVLGLPFHQTNASGKSWVLYGGPNGVGQTNDQIAYFHQDSDPGIPGAAEAGDEFGRALATGDINGDGYDDLVTGSPGEAIGTLNRAGMIHVLWGGSAGLTDMNAKGLSQADASVPGAAETGDEFGMSLAVGDVTGDGYADIAVGAPGENGYGGVTLLKGSSGGVDPAGATALVGAKTSVVTPRRLGQTMLLADTTGDGRSEVVTGAPDATVNGRTTAGAVAVYLGRGTGLSATGQTYWHQDSTNVPGSAESGDRFGSTLAAGALLGSTRTDLAIGVPSEAAGSLAKAGAVVVLPGAATTSGLTGTGSRYFDQNSAGVPGSAETNDQFGSALQVAVTPGYAYLAVGTVGEQVSQANGPGSGMLTAFVNDQGSLVPSSETIEGPELGEPGVWEVFRLGMASITN